MNAKNKAGFDMAEIKSMCAKMRITPFAEKIAEISTEARFLKGEIAYEDLIGEALSHLMSVRATNSLNSRLKALRLRDSGACLNSLVYEGRSAPTKLQAAELFKLGWIRAKRNLVLQGPSGVGKSYVAGALAVEAVRRGMKVWRARVPELLQKALLDRSMAVSLPPRLVRGRYDLVFLDDWGLGRVTEENLPLLLELADALENRSSVMLTTQLMPSGLDGWLRRSAGCDSIRSRLYDAALIITMNGASLRAERQDGFDMGLFRKDKKAAQANKADAFETHETIETHETFETGETIETHETRSGVSVPKHETVFHGMKHPVATRRKKEAGND